ncbi:MAG: hypothetical protein N2Z21_04425 [Candidatus Sumerlaeaceae bacterium]|nr:hypothetical protein [Candidatus Sumerlaeaceae bacterium]
MANDDNVGAVDSPADCWNSQRMLAVGGGVRVAVRYCAGMIQTSGAEDKAALRGCLPISGSAGIRRTNQGPESWHKAPL